VLLGGPNGAFDYSPATLQRLSRALASLARGGASFMVAPSTATTGALLDAVETGIRGAQRIILDSKGTILYRECLAAADLVVVTADSMNMTSEACATGRPVYVFMPDGGSPKFLRFHAALHELGVTRALPALPNLQVSWAYQPLDAAPRIAAEIARRFEAACVASAGA
jgi:mitochondrial fission protein ELM1